MERLTDNPVAVAFPLRLRHRQRRVQPPAFDSLFHVTSTNLGIRLGQPLGVPVDIEGYPYPKAAPDAGAYQHH